MMVGPEFKDIVRKVTQAVYDFVQYILDSRKYTCNIKSWQFGLNSNINSQHAVNLWLVVQARSLLICYIILL